MILGEDVGHFGGVFRVTRGLQEKYGAERVFDTPLAEAGIVGMAIGMALGGAAADRGDPVRRLHLPGLRPDRERAGEVPLPLAAGSTRRKVVIRAPYGGGIRGGHYHSQSPEAYFAHTPGLRVVIPSDPYQAKGLLLAALECDDPVIFLEPKRLYRASRGEVPDEYYTLPLDRARLVRPRGGRDPGRLRRDAAVAREAAALAEGEGYDVEVIDLVSRRALRRATRWCARSSTPGAWWSCTRRPAPAASAPS